MLLSRLFYDNSNNRFNVLGQKKKDDKQRKMYARSVLFSTVDNNVNIQPQIIKKQIKSLGELIEFIKELMIITPL